MTEHNFDAIEPPLPWDASAVPFFVPELTLPESQGLASGRIRAEQMSRHFLFVGETGSGKTESGIKPLLRSIVRYGSEMSDDALPCSALVIDPKHELGTVLAEESSACNRVVPVAHHGTRIDFFEEFRGTGTPVRVLLDQVFEALAPDSLRAAKKSGDNYYWMAKGRDAALALAEFAATIEQQGSNLGKELLDLSMWSSWHTRGSSDLTRATDVLAAAICRHLGDLVLPLPDTLHGTREALVNQIRSFLSKIRDAGKQTEKEEVVWRTIANETRKTLGISRQRFWDLVNIMGSQTHGDRGEAFARSMWRAANRPEPMTEPQERFAHAAGTRLVDDQGNWFSRIDAILSGIIDGASRDDSGSTELFKALNRIADRFGLQVLMNRLTWIKSPDRKTIFWLCDFARACISPLSKEELASKVWLNPATAPAEKTISVRECVEAGCIIHFQPPLIMQEEDETVGRILKRQFFRAVFARREQRRPVAYVCDEFQRFVTGDRESGEQSFLDRCRAYRTICVLATQSVASLRYALFSQVNATGNEALDNAVTVMLNNIGNKFFFRNTDPGTHTLLQQMIPHSPLFPQHVIAVRPLSTLRPGECYALLASGDWGRFRVRLEGSPINPAPDRGRCCSDSGDLAAAA